MTKAPNVSGSLRTPVSAGEVFDKISILEIKLLHSKPGTSARVNVSYELDLLMELVSHLLDSNATLHELFDELRVINKKLWDIEDKIRVCEANRDFGDTFIEIARSVYKTNDERAKVKRKINVLLNSDIVEEKFY